MDWVARMNEAIAYIEEHITDEISYEEVAKIACCSVYHFQRMFSFITDVSLSEYIRRRRLTLAAIDLQNSNIKVIDLALKYGYVSPEAFARAFQHMHGIAPTAARYIGAKLKVYPRLSFQFTIQGVEAMNYRIEEIDGFRVVGIKERISTEGLLSIEELYDRLYKIKSAAEAKGIIEKLWGMRKSTHKSKGILGILVGEPVGDKEHFHYMLAAVSDEEQPESMESMKIQAAKWAVFEVPGPPERLKELWGRLYKEWLPTSTYEFAHAPSLECYLPPEENMNELWVPVIKRTQP